MFIKEYSKYNKTTIERYTIYRLCESYRIDGYIRHRTIIGFGKLEEPPEVEQKKQLALRVEEMLKHGPGRLVIMDLTHIIHHKNDQWHVIDYNLKRL